jgi:hypothetical protein
VHVPRIAAEVIVSLDLVEVGVVAEGGNLIELPGVGPEVREVD